MSVARSTRSATAAQRHADSLLSSKSVKLSPSSPESFHIKKRNRVVFETADIVEFEPTLFTTSVTSGGIPVGLSSKERSRVRRRLDSFELERQHFRIERQNYMEEGYLNPNERKEILSQAGCAEQTILQVEKQVNEIIAHRRESNEVDLSLMFGLESADAENLNWMEEEEDVEKANVSENVPENEVKEDKEVRIEPSVSAKVQVKFCESATCQDTVAA